MKKIKRPKPLVKNSKILELQWYIEMCAVGCVGTEWMTKSQYDGAMAWLKENWPGFKEKCEELEKLKKDPKEVRLYKLKTRNI